MGLLCQPTTVDPFVTASVAASMTCQVATRSEEAGWEVLYCFVSGP
eukprot:COSAG01_NODE_8405_length_2795_cov_5.327522_2_plen_46_part_00